MGRVENSAKGQIASGIKTGLLCAVSVGIVLTGLTGCSLQESSDLTQLKKDQAALKSQYDDLRSQLAILKVEQDKVKAKQNEMPTGEDQLKVKMDSQVATAKGATVIENTPATAASPSPTEKRIGFTDIDGMFGEKEIKALSTLGVFDYNGGKFLPNQAISRGEFVEWLVGANNIYWCPSIRLAETGPAQFPDVPLNHRYYKQIQGMVNSGFVVGHDDKTFKPNVALTREEMIAIKTQLDVMGAGAPTNKTPAAVLAAANGPENLLYLDKNQISKRYYDAFINIKSEDLDRSFGGGKYLRPRQAVTRAEAAVCISKFSNGNSINYHTGNAIASAANK